MEHRLQIDRSGPVCTGFSTHSGAMDLQIRRKLASLGPILAIDAISPTGSWIWLTTCFHFQVIMSSYSFSFGGVHLVGGSARHPIEPLATRLGALRLPRPQGRTCSQ